MTRASRSALRYRTSLVQEFLLNVGNGVAAGSALAALCLLGWRLVAAR